MKYFNKKAITIGLIILLIICILLIIYLTRNTEKFKVNNTNNLEIISQNKEPEILLVKNFLTHAECDHLIKEGEPFLKKHQQVCSEEGDKISDARTSWTASIGSELITENKQDKILLIFIKETAEFCMRPIVNIEHSDGKIYKWTVL